ncbi:hypothetical protein QTG56_00775 [Rossellomorea sp. AcN35-11]|nr:hypothetical protein [Rossellomorea aquimaris]WJV29737.1 hypothetical protein QTG56_00775 [Rossellomorea sp. AcN35-11]
MEPKWVEYVLLFSSLLSFVIIFSNRLKLLYVIFKVCYLALVLLIAISYTKFVIDTESFLIDTGAFIYGSILVGVGLWGWIKFDPLDDSPTQSYIHTILFLYVYSEVLMLFLFILHLLGIYRF